TDISTGATPTAFWFRFEDGTAALSLGQGVGGGGGSPSLLPSSTIEDNSNFFGPEFGNTNQTTISMQFIPTPGTLGAAAAGLLLVSARRRRA
ncbi:MAG: hypothetical protein AAFP26_08350, partial [Planctomycetota bacterium]